jgi:hypothetical protein
MQQVPSPKRQAPSKVPRRIFGWLTLAAFVLTLLFTSMKPVHDYLAIFTFFSFFLWIAAIVGERQAAAPPPPLPIQQKRKVTAEDVYLEAAQLRELAQRAASQEALTRVAEVPDEADGMMLLGAAIDPERHPQQSILLQRVVNRERWTRIAIAIFAFLGGGGR